MFCDIMITNFVGIFIMIRVRFKEALMQYQFIVYMPGYTLKLCLLIRSFVGNLLNLASSLFSRFIHVVTLETQASIDHV